MNDLSFIFIGDSNLERISLKDKILIIKGYEYSPNDGATYFRAIDEAFLNKLPIRIKKQRFLAAPC